MAACEFSVADTGIGIPESDVGRVFDEFVQIENPLQRRVKGTGLGLPLSKRLAELLGGSVAVQSTLGGARRSRSPSRWSSRLRTTGPGRTDAGRTLACAGDRGLRRRHDALRARPCHTRFQVVPARSIAAATTALDVIRPAAIVLDLRLQGRTPGTS